MKLTSNRINVINKYSLIFSIILVLSLSTFALLNVVYFINANDTPTPGAAITSDTVIYNDGVKDYTYGDAQEGYKWIIGINNAVCAAILDLDKDLTPETLVLYGQDEINHTSIAQSIGVELSGNSYSSLPAYQERSMIDMQQVRGVWTSIYSDKVTYVKTYNFAPIGDASCLFAYLGAKEYDLTGFNAEYVTDMSYMFAYTTFDHTERGNNDKEIKIIFPEHFNTENVTSIKGIAYYGFDFTDVTATDDVERKLTIEWPEEKIAPNATNFYRAFSNSLYCEASDMTFDVYKHFDFSHASGSSNDIDNISMQELFQHFKAYGKGDLTINFGDDTHDEIIFGTSNDQGVNSHMFDHIATGYQGGDVTINFPEHTVINGSSLISLFQGICSGNSTADKSVCNLTINFGDRFEIKETYTSLFNMVGYCMKGNLVMNFGSYFGTNNNTQYDNASLFNSFAYGLEGDATIRFADHMELKRTAAGMTLFQYAFSKSTGDIDIDFGDNFDLDTQTNYGLLFCEAFVSDLSAPSRDISLHFGENFDITDGEAFINFFAGAVKGKQNVELIFDKGIVIDNPTKSINLSKMFQQVGEGGNNVSIIINGDIKVKAQYVYFNNMFDHVGQGATGDVSLTINGDIIAEGDACDLSYMFTDVGIGAQGDVSITINGDIIAEGDACDLSHMFYNVGQEAHDVNIDFDKKIILKNCNETNNLIEIFEYTGKEANSLNITFGDDIIVEGEGVDFTNCFSFAGWDANGVNINFLGDVKLLAPTSLKKAFNEMGGYSYVNIDPDLRCNLIFNKDLDLSGVNDITQMMYSFSKHMISNVEIKGNITKPSAQIPNINEVFGCANLDLIDLRLFDLSNVTTPDVASATEINTISSSFAKDIYLSNNKDVNEKLAIPYRAPFHYSAYSEDGTLLKEEILYPTLLKEQTNFGDINPDDVYYLKRKASLNNAYSNGYLKFFNKETRNEITSFPIEIDNASRLSDIVELRFYDQYHNLCDILEEDVDYVVNYTDESVNYFDPLASNPKTITITGIDHYEDSDTLEVNVLAKSIKPEDLTFKNVNSVNKLSKKKDNTSQIPSSAKLCYINPINTSDVINFDFSEGDYTKEGVKISSANNNLDVSVKTLSVSSDNNPSILARYITSDVTNYTEELTIPNVGKIEDIPSGGGGGKDPSPKPSITTLSIITVQAVEPVIKGYEDGTIKPNEYISRQEFLVMLSRIDPGYNKNQNYEEYTKIFTDVANNKDVYWSRNEIGYYTYKGIAEGYENNVFNPKGNIKRSEVAKLICKYKNYNIDNIDISNTNFKDISNKWYTNYVAILEKKGILDGKTNDTFSPEEYIKRSEVAKIICMIENRNTNYDTSNPTQDMLNITYKYTDLDISKWYFKYIYALAR